MTDEQTLFAVFALFYVVECLHWLPLHATVLQTWAIRRGWVAGSPSPHVSASGNGLAFAWPLPPLGSFLVTQQWPVIPDATGLWIGAGQLAEGKRLSWEAINPKHEKRTVRIAPGVEVQCASIREAELLVDFLREAAAQKPAKRQQTLDTFWRTSLSLPRARAALRKYHLAGWALRMPCVAVQFMCFVWISSLFWRFGGSSWRVLTAFGTLLAMTTLVAFIWRSLNSRLFAGSKRKSWAQMLHLAFMPVHTMRAHDLIGVDVLAGLHPLTGAAAVLKPEPLRAFASQTWRTWKFRPATDALLPATALVLPRLQACCQKLGLTLDELEASPAPQGGAASYCPRCHSQFSLASTTCGQCGGLPTLPWLAAVSVEK